MLDEVHSIGGYLIAKKAELGHGRFRQWVEGPDGPPISYRSARLYMRLRREIDRTLEAAAQGYVVPPRPTSMRRLAADAQTPRGRLRPGIGAASAIALPSGTPPKTRARPPKPACTCIALTKYTVSPASVATCPRHGRKKGA